MLVAQSYGVDAASILLAGGSYTFVILYYRKKN
jgi:hypothetical protein